jgi:hypothetical protein
MPKLLPAKTTKQTKVRKEWSARFHLLLNITLPIVLLLMIRANLYELAIVLALFSKWRVFAVRPHHLAVNIRSNATDIVVKLGTLIFMIQYQQPWVQLGWTLWYIFWLTTLKPRSETFAMGLQALAAEVIGLSALFQFSNNIPEPILLIVVWIIALSAARHFLSNYEEPWARVIAHLWAIFVTQLAWVLNNWLLVYVAVPQLVIIVTLLSYVLASLYHAYMNETLRAAFVRQQVLMTTIVLIVMIVLADWHGQV